MEDDIIIPKDICEIDIQSQMEEWVDRFGLEYVLEALACMCADKVMPGDNTLSTEQKACKRVWLALNGLIEDLFPNEEA